MRCHLFLPAMSPFSSPSAREPWIVGKAIAGFLVALGWMLMSTSAQATSLWVHNGSTVELASDGDLRQFYYYEPKGSLARAGVDPGTLLFDGRSTGTSYIGTAYFFNPKCGRSSYEVSGSILNNQTRIVLEGQAPKVDNDCHITGYFTDLLEFKFVRQINGSAVVQPPTGSGNRPPQNYEIGEGEGGSLEAYLPMDDQKNLTLILAGCWRAANKKAVTVGLTVDDNVTLSPGLSRLRNLPAGTTAMIDLCINAACTSHEWSINELWGSLSTVVRFGQGTRSIEVVIPQDSTRYQFRGDVDEILKQICR
jgi:hypothetical protein